MKKPVVVDVFSPYYVVKSLKWKKQTLKIDRINSQLSFWSLWLWVLGLVQSTASVLEGLLFCSRLFTLLNKWLLRVELSFIQFCFENIIQLLTINLFLIFRARYFLERKCLSDLYVDHKSLYWNKWCQHYVKSQL